jgi:hypothetical protein
MRHVHLHVAARLEASVHEALKRPIRVGNQCMPVRAVVMHALAARLGAGCVLGHHRACCDILLQDLLLIGVFHGVKHACMRMLGAAQGCWDPSPRTTALEQCTDLFRVCLRISMTAPCCVCLCSLCTVLPAVTVCTIVCLYV